MLLVVVHIELELERKELVLDLLHIVVVALAEYEQ
jgi:hypothetical protein